MTNVYVLEQIDIFEDLTADQVKLVDEICVYIAPKILGSHGSVSIDEPFAKLTQAVGLYNVNIKPFGDDVRLSGLTEKAVKELSISQI